MALWRNGQGGIDITTSIAFGYGPANAAPVFTDVSAWVQEISTMAGRTSEFTEFSPATAQVSLNNRTRRFDPDNAAGPYFGLLVPMVPIKITATKAGVTVSVFAGFVLGWPQQYEGRDSVSVLSCVDGQRLIKNAPLATSALAKEITTDTPGRSWELQTDTLAAIGTYDLTAVSGTPSFVERRAPLGATSGLAGPILLRHGDGSGWPSSSVGYVRAFEGVAYLDTNIVPTANVFDLTFYGYNTLTVGLTSDRAHWQITYADPGDTDDWLTFTLALPVPLNQAFHFYVAITTSVMNVYIDGIPAGLGVPLNLSGAPAVAGYGYGEISLAAGTSMSHVTTYELPISASRITAHAQAAITAWGHPYGERGGARITRILDEIGWPAAKRNIATGDTTQGPYLPNSEPALDKIRQIERSEQGLVFISDDGKMTFLDRQYMWAATPTVIFTDDPTSPYVRITGLETDGNTVDTIRNIVTASYASIGAITRSDTTSKLAYGEAHETLDTPTLPDGRSASTLAAYVLRNLKDPKTRILSLTAPLRIGAGYNPFASLIGVDVGQVVQIEYTPLNVGSRVTKKAMTQGVAHLITKDQWTVTSYLSPAVKTSTEAPYLTFGHATRGKIGAADANLIPF